MYAETLTATAVAYVTSGRAVHPYNVTDALSVVWSATEAMVTDQIKRAQTPGQVQDYKNVQAALKTTWGTLQSGKQLLQGEYP